MLNQDYVNELTIEQVDAEIKERKDLIGRMVGHLYPNIVQAEIDQLEERRDEIINPTRPQVYVVKFKRTVEQEVGCLVRIKSQKDLDRKINQLHDLLQVMACFGNQDGITVKMEAKLTSVVEDYPESSVIDLR